MLKDFTKEEFDVVIMAGQSNAVGHGIGDVDRPYVPGPNVWYLNNEFYQKIFTITPATEYARGNDVQSNLGLTFAESYLQSGMLKESRKLLFVRAAVGGTGFLEGRWKITDDLYRCMIDMTRTALHLNPRNRLIALLWHQGETDAIHRATYAQHYENLITLVKTARSDLGRPDLPFIAGDFVPQWKNDNVEICEPVVSAIRDVCRDCGNGAFVESDGLYSNLQENAWLATTPGGLTETIHFSRSSVYELGKRYFAAFTAIGKER